MSCTLTFEIVNGFQHKSSLHTVKKQLNDDIWDDLFHHDPGLKSQTSLWTLVRHPKGFDINWLMSMILVQMFSKLSVVELQFQNFKNTLKLLVIIAAGKCPAQYYTTRPSMFKRMTPTRTMSSKWLRRRVKSSIWTGSTINLDFEI